MKRLAQWNKLIRLSAFLLLGALLLTLGSKSLLAQDNVWEARYWNNISLAGTPVLQRTETEINYDWGNDSPHPIVSQDDFSAEWIQNVDLTAGNYRFTATMDDGMRVWVDDVQIIDSWYDSQAHTVNAEIFLQSGNHQIRVAYYDTGGEAVAKLDWVQLTDVQDDWLAQYYNNMVLGGAPVYVRNEATINLNTAGSPAPQVTADQFSVRWTQDVSFNPGIYRFNATADDGVRLWVNNELVIDEWQNQAATTYTAVVNIPDGTVPVRMEYYEDQGAAVAQLDWLQISSNPNPVPPSVPSVGTWRGEYYNNTSLAGTPALVRNDSSIDFYWGISSPAPNTISEDRFSVRWSQTFNLAPGAYQLTATADDGVRVWADGTEVIDGWEVQAETSFTATINHNGGSLPIVVEYFENTGIAQVRLDLTAVGTTPSQPEPNPDVVTATMTEAYYLNVRSGPGVSFNNFDTLSRGETVTVLGRNTAGSWIEIVLPNGSTGWVSSSYMTISTAVVNLPITG